MRSRNGFILKRLPRTTRARRTRLPRATHRPLVSRPVRLTRHRAAIAAGAAGVSIERIQVQCGQSRNSRRQKGRYRAGPAQVGGLVRDERSESRLHHSKSTQGNICEHRFSRARPRIPRSAVVRDDDFRHFTERLTMAIRNVGRGNAWTRRNGSASETSPTGAQKENRFQEDY